MANETNMQALAQSLKQVRSATAELTSQMRKLNRIGRSSSKKHAAACPGGVCAAPGGGFGGAGRGAGQGPAYSRSLQGLMSTAVRNALSGDFRRTLRSMLSSIVRGITTTAGRSAGGGLGGAGCSLPSAGRGFGDGTGSARPHAGGSDSSRFRRRGNSRTITKTT